MSDSALASKKDVVGLYESQSLDARIHAACQQACDAIAPAWPLDQSIAVNPYWKRTHHSVRHVAARMAVLADIRVFPQRELMSQAWQLGSVKEQDLQHAYNHNLFAQSLGITPNDCIQALNQPLNVDQLPLLIDVLDDAADSENRLSWRQAITHQVSQTCAEYFDTQQAEWQPDRTEGLYAFWRDALTHDHGIGLLMGLPNLEKSLDKLPLTSQEAEAWVMQRLSLPEHVWADYLEAVLLTVNGWASWCAYLGWQAELSGKVDSHLRELLAIRLAWGAILLECKEESAVNFAFKLIQRQWYLAPELIQQAEETLVIDEVWQQALEASYQGSLAKSLQHHEKAEQPEQVDVQAAFCIDVRSERFRRAFEEVCPAAQTIGMAGFFGLPVAYTPMATEANRPQLPGLLAPTMQVSDTVTQLHKARGQHKDLTDKVASLRKHRLANKKQLHAASKWPSAAFSFVEVAGFGYLAKLADWVKPVAKQRKNTDRTGLPKRYQAITRPGIINISISQKVELAEKVLISIGLKNGFSSTVLLISHGSQSANNAHAAGLDCGACCGQSGEVNARVLAGILNDVNVRQGLQNKGIYIPLNTTFIAALHNTTTDEIEAFDLDLITDEALKHWETIAPMLQQAGDKVRRERAANLNINSVNQPGKLLDNYRRRANDGAQTRPEWGLAGNAAFVIAPRSRTKGKFFDGRSFLHEYDPAKDSNGEVLEQLMTAPMLVTHWINWQYHASTCDPKHMGSGNKLLHNVVGGQVGVFEGNGGDLRIGLSKQSLHDGEEWVHSPVRLTVVIDAPTSRISRIIEKHPTVKYLIDNTWLHLWSYGANNQLLHYQEGKWKPLSM